MEPIDADVEEVLEDGAGVVSGLQGGETATRRSTVRKTDAVIYLLPVYWQNITDSLLALLQSLAPVDGSPAPGEIPTGGGPAGALKRLVKRLAGRIKGRLLEISSRGRQGVIIAKTAAVCDGRTAGASC